MANSQRPKNEDDDDGAATTVPNERTTASSTASSAMEPLLIRDGNDSESGVASVDASSAATTIDDDDVRRPSSSFDVLEMVSASTSRHGVWVLLLWLCVVPPLGLRSLPRLIRSADSTLGPQLGTPSYEALAAYRSAYDGGNSTTATAPPLFMLLEQKESGDGDDDGTLTDTGSAVYRATSAFVREYVARLRLAHPGTGAEDYYAVRAEFPVLADRVLSSADGRAVLVRVDPPPSVVGKAATEAFTEDAVDLSRASPPVPPGVRASFTGRALFQKDERESTRRDMARLDRIALPASLVILGYAVGRTTSPLLLLPVLAIGCTVCLWSVVLWWIVSTTSLRITPITPSVMMSLTIAMSVDYSLFWLSRVSEEIRDDRDDDRGPRLRRAVSVALRTSGHSILVSGCTLSVCLIGTVILPNDMMVGLGVGSCVAVLSCVVVSLTLVPAALRTRLGEWAVYHEGLFGGDRRKRCGERTTIMWRRASEKASMTCSELRKWIQEKLDRAESADRSSSNDQQEHELRRPLIDNNNEDDENLLNGRDDRKALSAGDRVSEILLRARRNGDDVFPNRRDDSSSSASADLYSRFVRLLLADRARAAVVLAGLLLFVIMPVASFVPSLRTSISAELLLPRDSPSLATFKRLGADFSRGCLAPYKLVFLSQREGTKMDSQEGFRFMHDALRTLTGKNVTGTRTTVNHHHSNEEEKFLVEAVRTLLDEHGISWGGKGREFVEDESIAFDELESRLATAFEKALRQTERTNNIPLWATDDDYVATLPSLEAPPPSLVVGTPDLNPFTGIPVVNGTFISYTVYGLAQLCERVARDLLPHNKECPLHALRALTYLADRTCSHDHRAAFVTTLLAVDPFGREGVAWLLRARDALDDLSRARNGTFSVAIVGGAAVERDAVDAVFAAFPRAAALTVVLVFAFVGLFLRSAGAPARSVLSIGATAAFVYGSAVLVYQYGALDWTGMRGLASDPEGICFLPPVMALTVVVGLGLDYDVFLTTRILELRDSGEHDHSESVVVGCERTGSIITCAGVIMCVAFGGMLFSESAVLNQFSFFLVDAVLLDTFVVRTILVPIVLELCGEKRSWWPRTFPEVRPRRPVVPCS